MKKFASLLLCLMLVLSMTVIGAMSVSAAATVSQETGELTITKSNKDDSTQKLEGAVFTYYKVMDYYTDGTFQFADPYKDALESSTNADVVGYLASLTRSDDGENYVSYGSTQNFEKTIDTLLAVKTNGTSMTATNIEGITNATMPEGVYLVEETTPPSGYVVSVAPFLVYVKANETSFVYPKDKKMTVTKGVEDNGEVVSAKSASVGDRLKFVVESSVPNYSAETLQNLKTNEPDRFQRLPLIIRDTLSPGLTLNNLYFANVKIGEKNYNRSTGGVYIYSEALADGSTNVFVVIPSSVYFDSQTDNLLGQKITFTYYATLNENAVVTDGNDNKVDVEYANDPTTFEPSDFWDYDPTDPTPPEPPTEPDPDPDDPDPKTPDDDPSDPDNPPPGEDPDDPEPPYDPDDPDPDDPPTPPTDPKDPEEPADDPDPDPDPDPDKPVVPPTPTKVYTYELDITKLLDSGNYTGAAGDVTFSLTKDGETVYATGTNGSYVATSDATAAAVFGVDASGALVIKGLGAGTYELTEETTVADYNKLSAPITIYVEDTKDATTSVVTGVVNGYVYGGADNSKKTISEDGTGVMNLDVNNSKTTFNLPETGGWGLLLFTLGGAVVLAVAIFLFSTSKKKKAE